MNRDHMQFDVRKAKIYKDIYRPSTKLSRLFGTLFSIILRGQSQVGSPDYFISRKTK